MIYQKYMASMQFKMSVKSSSSQFSSPLWGLSGGSLLLWQIRPPESISGGRVHQQTDEDVIWSKLRLLQSHPRKQVLVTYSRVARLPLFCAVLDAGFGSPLVLVVFIMLRQALYNVISSVACKYNEPWCHWHQIFSLHVCLEQESGRPLGHLPFLLVAINLRRINNIWMTIPYGVHLILINIHI